MGSIKAIYIAHSVGCAGWDIDLIYENTIFKKSSPIGKINPRESNIAMLDWDFKKATRDFNAVWKKYLKTIKEREFEIVMSPDSLPGMNPDFVLEKYWEIQKYQKRVVLPVTSWHEKYRKAGIEIAYPNASGFNKIPRNYWIPDVQDLVTHILGGSPHSQKKLLSYFPKVTSLDGNQIFNVAIKYGKYWSDGRWVKPEPELKNEECFKKSVKNVNDYFTQI